jgi:glycosyltransferase involved in cell wall biosynthesis
MRTKVVQFIHGFSIGGAEKLVYQYALLMNKEKFEVYVIAISNEHTKYDIGLADNGINVIYLNDLIDSKVFGTKRFKRIVHVLFRPWCIHVLLRKLNPDVIHTHLFLNEIVLKARISKKTRLIHTLHNDVYELTRSDVIESHKNKKAIDKLRKKYRVQLVVLNDEGKAAVKDIFNDSDAVIINNGVDVDYLQGLNSKDYFKDKYSIDKDVFIVGHVGRLNKTKNQSFLLEVFVEIKKIKPNALLWLVGDGEYKSLLETKSKQFGIDNSIVFWGNVDKPEELVKMMDVFIMPSLYEGVSLAMVECQIIGIPMLVSKSIPDKAIISNLVQRKALSESVMEWAETAISLSEKKIEPIYNELDKWNISNAVMELEKIYLDEA